MVLINGLFGKEYEVLKIQSEDEELNDFLFTLGCYEGQPITLISTVSDNYVVSIKDSRYNIDKNLAKTIIVR